MRTEWNWKRNNYRSRSQGQSIKINQTKVQKHEIHKGVRTITEEIFESPYLRICLRTAAPVAETTLLTENERKGKVNGLTGRLEGVAQNNLKL